jgi:hypothetical protein
LVRFRYRHDENKVRWLEPFFFVVVLVVFFVRVCKCAEDVRNKKFVGGFNTNAREILRQKMTIFGLKKNDKISRALFSPFEYFVHIVVLKTLLCVKKQSSLSLSLE